MSARLFEAYAAGGADAFFDGHFARPGDWERVRRVARPLVPTLADALDAQDARYRRAPARQAHLRALREGAAAVVTGQQVGLFLGPLFALYKAASTIRLARALSEEWSAPVVPVFWLQTEDHDLAEIAVCHVARAGGEPLSLTLDVPAGSVSVAHRTLPDGVTEVLAALGAEIGRLPHGEEHLACLARHYRPGAGWGEAFAGVLAELFAEEGLVLIDPRDPALAPLAAPVHRRALVDAQPIARALAERGRALEAGGWTAAVHVRGDAPLSFFHPEGPEGPRIRLEAGGSRAHTIAQLLDALERRPATFSTSALLRPILQDTWLPTAAYVGGPGEVAYFAQLAPVYAAFELPMPLVVPRVRLRILEEATRRRLERLHLTAADACRPFEEALALATEGVTHGPEGDVIARRLVEAVDRALDDAGPALRNAGEGVDRAVAKTRATVARAAGKLGRNYDKARRHRDGDTVDHVRRLQASLLPGGMPQERFFGMASFAARYGQRPFVERVLGAAAPLRTDIEDLAL